MLQKSFIFLPRSFYKNQFKDLSRNLCPRKITCFSSRNVSNCHICRICCSFTLKNALGMTPVIAIEIALKLFHSEIASEIIFFRYYQVLSNILKISRESAWRVYSRTAPEMCQRLPMERLLKRFQKYLQQKFLSELDLESLEDLILSFIKIFRNCWKNSYRIKEYMVFQMIPQKHI